MNRNSPVKRRPISPASTSQRAKVKNSRSIVSGMLNCDPAHLVPRAMRGCDHEDCVVPLTRVEHRAYDAKKLDLLPYLVDKERIPELQHALTHVGLLTLLELLTGERWIPRNELPLP